MGLLATTGKGVLLGVGVTLAARDPQPATNSPPAPTRTSRAKSRCRFVILIWLADRGVFAEKWLLCCASIGSHPGQPGDGPLPGCRRPLCAESCTPASRPFFLGPRGCWHRFHDCPEGVEKMVSNPQLDSPFDTGLRLILRRAHDMLRVNRGQRPDSQTGRRVLCWSFSTPSGQALDSGRTVG